MQTEILNNIQNNIKFISYKDFELWDVKRYLGNSLCNEVGYVKIKSILIPFKKKISHEEVIKNKYQIISKINFSGNLFLRDFEEIKKYRGNLYLVPQNTIIFSKINARHGCIYFHQGETPFVVSNEYPVFLVDLGKVNGEYLKQYLRSSKIKEHLNSKTTGISKARIKSNEFLSVLYPLKTLEIQKNIINEYQLKKKNTETFLLEIRNKEELIEQTIIKILDIDLPEIQEKKKGIYFSKFSIINKWDIWSNESIGKSRKYRNGFFQELINGSPMYGANVKAIKVESDVRYIRITDINEDGTLNEDIVSAEKVEEKYLLKENDFLIARSGNTVGKTFLYKKENGKAIFAGYLVKYNLNLEKVNPEYLLYFTKSKLFKNWIKSNQRISGQPNINGQKYLLSPIVIPPIDTQNKVANQIKIIKDKIQLLKSKVNLNYKEAIKEFEQAIFKN